jgi:hypothetical protein
MVSKQKQKQLGQKENFERKLKDRLSILSERGVDSSKIDKDTVVKKLRADVRAMNARLNAIDRNEKKTEELAKIKAEKAAAPRKEQEEPKDKEQEKAPEKGKGKKKKSALS